MANGLTKLIDLAQDANATAPKLPAPNQLAALLALKALAKLERENRSVRTM